MQAQSTGSGPVVVGVDGSEPSLVALRHGIREASLRGTELHVVHVLDVTPAVLHLRGDVTITTKELAQSDRGEVWKRVEPILEEAGVDVVRVDLEGEPKKMLLDYCEESGASVLVVGPRGRGRVERLIVGSTAEAAMRSAKCDVLVVKAGG